MTPVKLTLEAVATYLRKKPGFYFCDECICEALATKHRLPEIKSLAFKLGGWAKFDQRVGE